jgi:hypothetical protein
MDAREPVKCQQCGIELRSPIDQQAFCDVCAYMWLVMAASQWFLQAHLDWVTENTMRRLKLGLEE